jgi:hypothetical protein
LQKKMTCRKCTARKHVIFQAPQVARSSYQVN